MRDNRRGRRRAPRFLTRTLLLLLALAGAGYAWYNHRPRPEPHPDRPLYQGVTYRREVRSTPRPVVVHVVTVDLRAPGIEFLVTPGDPKAERPLKGMTTSAFLKEHRLQLAVNGDFFYPWRSNHPLDYYPHVGDPVSVEGDAVSRGVRYATRDRGRYLSTLYFTRDNGVCIDRKPRGVYHALGGHRLRLDAGSAAEGEQPIHPRTAVGLSGDGDTLYLVVVDGRQPNYSEGVTTGELAEILRGCGAKTAINLDGGGSTALVVANEKGEPDVLNSPIDHRIPGRERAVANHLGLFARPLPDDD